MTPEQKAAAAERLARGREIARQRREAERAAAAAQEQTVTETTTQPAQPAWTMDDLKAIVAAGMPIGEARALLTAGYGVAEVLELAALQRQQSSALAAEAQTATAKAMQKAMRPENEFHPGISAFSYPEGDRARPKSLPFEFLYNGYPCHKFLETEHWREVELMAQVQPGEYTVLRKDGSKMTVEVRAEHNADGQVTKLDVRFPVSRETKWLVPPKMVVLYQIVHPDNPHRRFMEATQEWMQIAFGAEAVPA